MKAKLHMKNTMDELYELKALRLYYIKQIHSIKKFLRIYHKKSIFIKKQTGQYLHNPSSVRSTLMIKNIKPRAPSFCPPTRVFTQPFDLSSDNRLPGPS